MTVSSGSITFHAPPKPKDDGGLVQRRCVRVKQDNSQRTPCPGGGSDIMQLVRRMLGFTVAGDDAAEAPDGVFRVPIITQDDGQGHSLSINYGNISEPSEQLTRYNETVFATPSDWTAAGEGVELELSGKLDFAPDQIVLARIVGTARDSSGVAVLAPLLQVQGSKLLTSQAVHAQLAISYDAYTTTHLVEIAPRPDATDNYYDSNLTIISSCGGVERIKVEVPQCFKDFRATQKDFWDEWKDFWKDFREEGILRLLDRDLKPTGTVVETISGPQEIQGGSDLEFEWNFCGNHQLISDSRGVFDDLAKLGPVCYPGVLCSLIGYNCDGEAED